MIAVTLAALLWTAHPSDGVTMKLTQEAEATRLDFDFHGHGGYAIARKQVDLDLPPNYQFVFRVKGETGPQNLEFKLIDSSGENVWWLNRRDFVFPREWTTVRTKKRQIEFAWGPIGGGELKHVAAMEVVVTAGSGGKGSVWFTDPVLELLPPTPTEPLRFTSANMDLPEKREIGGLTIDWKTQPRDFTVTVDGVAQKRTNTRFVWLPDVDAKTIRIEGGEVAAVTVQPPGWAKNANDFASIVAKDAPRGEYPRYFIGEQAYWTIVGADGAEEEALVGEDGAVEPFKSGPSIEPFLWVDGKRLTWADVTITQSLRDGDLPIPSVTWTAGKASMTMTAAVSSSSMLQLEYRVKNAELELQVRPFQVNPSTQFLNTTGGVATVQHKELKHLPCTSHGPSSGLRPPSPRTRVEGPPPAVAPLPASRGEGGRRPGEGRCTREVRIAIPLRAGAKRESLDYIAKQWREKLDRVAIDIGGAPDIADTIRANVAYTLIARDGPSLEPGTRSYDRAWIRDGALISSLLLRLGHEDVAKDFAEWFATFQYSDGKVPCCVDARGADPVPENDSHGQLIFLVAEIYRYTGDRAFVQRLWPHVEKAARYIEKLRSENHGEFEGLVTESISHEGYSAKPVHSYWDDVFALKGLIDAKYLAGILGTTIDVDVEDFRRDLAASIRRVIDKHKLDYVPASVELADFDPTSTSIGISPLGLASLLPQRELQRTYERYFANISQPRDAYTPYEMRNIGALIRLGETNRALQLVDRFLADRRPIGWKHWAEVVGTEYRKPRFIGDMPHVWIASDFIRSILDAIAYEDEDGMLVVGAGVPDRWLPVHVGPLRTHAGPVEIWIDRNGVRVEGAAKERVRTPRRTGARD